MSFPQKFIDYYKENFFGDDTEELSEFLESLTKPVPRTIRINPEKKEEVVARLQNEGWILVPSAISNIFFLDRREDFDPLERRIGFALDHLVGNFYIQELAAAYSVTHLADGKIINDALTILDMASSPGGKTTQLAEYFPNSFIVANEPNRNRIPQLLQNLERMGSANIGVTLYLGQYFSHEPEMFDRVLLDAPCSGEGTLYKGTEATKYWNEKSIHAIATLQKKLILAGFMTLKTGGEMLYSTCSMNKKENEEVIDFLCQKYGDSLEILFQKRFWPHKDHTGGFFITKLRKTRSIPHTGKIEKKKTHSEIQKYQGNIKPWKLRPGYVLYQYKEKILVVAESIPESLLEHLYFMKLGDILGTIENRVFVPSPTSYRYLILDEIPNVQIDDEKILDTYLRGNDLPSEGPDGDILLWHGAIPFALEKRKNHLIQNRFPKSWRRK